MWGFGLGLELIGCYNSDRDLLSFHVYIFHRPLKKLVEGGAIEALCLLTAHEDSEIQINAVWALMVSSMDIWY